MGELRFVQPLRGNGRHTLQCRIVVSLEGSFVHLCKKTSHWIILGVLLLVFLNDLGVLLPLTTKCVGGRVPDLEQMRLA
jgi:hypothetical protein